MLTPHELPWGFLGVDGRKETEALLHLRLQGVMQKHRVVSGVRTWNAILLPEKVHVIETVLEYELFLQTAHTPDPRPRFHFLFEGSPVISIAGFGVVYWNHQTSVIRRRKANTGDLVLAGLNVDGEFW
jgi:hypothetical protein